MIHATYPAPGLRKMVHSEGKNLTIRGLTAMSEKIVEISLARCSFNWATMGFFKFVTRFEAQALVYAVKAAHTCIELGAYYT